MNNPLDAIFRAKSVAIVGVSLDEDTPGHMILQNLINSCFQGSIYPISSESDTILWLKTYSKLTEVEDAVDLAVLAGSVAELPMAMEDAGKAGVKTAIIISDETEIYSMGDEIQAALETAKLYHIKVLGPNSQGIIYTHNRLCASRSLITARGNIAIISESEAIGSAIAGWANDEGIGISGFASLGDKTGINELDLLEYFAEDPNTKVIALYLETLVDKAKFVELCTIITKKKPIVLLKSDGLFPGWLDDWNSICAEANLVQCKDVVQFYDCAKILALGQPMTTRRVAIITSSKGGGLLAAASAIENGLEVIELEDSIKNQLRGELGHCSVANPLNLPKNMDGKKYLKIAEIINRQEPDATIFIFSDGDNGIIGMLELLPAVPITQQICCYFGARDSDVQQILKMQRNGYSVFPTPERAMAAVKALHQWGCIVKN